MLHVIGGKRRIHWIYGPEVRFLPPGQILKDFWNKHSVQVLEIRSDHRLHAHNMWIGVLLT